MTKENEEFFAKKNIRDKEARKEYRQSKMKEAYCVGDCGAVWERKSNALSCRVEDLFEYL